MMAVIVFTIEPKGTPHFEREKKRVGLGTYLRLCAPVSNGRRSAQLKEDTNTRTPTG
jgi:hypothetical protein